MQPHSTPSPSAATSSQPPLAITVEPDGGDRPPSPKARRAWIALPLAAAALLAWLIWHLVADRTIVAPAPPTTIAPASGAVGVPANEWIKGDWGVEGDCTDRIAIAPQAHRIVLSRADGTRTEQTIITGEGDMIVTAEATYRHHPPSGGGPDTIAVSLADPRFDDYGLTRCTGH